MCLVVGQISEMLRHKSISEALKMDSFGLPSAKDMFLLLSAFEIAL